MKISLAEPQVNKLSENFSFPTNNSKTNQCRVFLTSAVLLFPFSSILLFIREKPFKGIFLRNFLRNKKSPNCS